MYYGNGEKIDHPIIFFRAGGLNPILILHCFKLRFSPSTRRNEISVLKNSTLECVFGDRFHRIRVKLRAVSRLQLNPKKAGAIDVGRERRSTHSETSFTVASPLKGLVDRARFFFFFGFNSKRETARSLDTCVRKVYPHRKSCVFKRKRIGVDGALVPTDNLTHFQLSTRSISDIKETSVHSK